MPPLYIDIKYFLYQVLLRARSRARTRPPHDVGDASIVSGSLSAAIMPSGGTHKSVVAPLCERKTLSAGCRRVQKAFHFETAAACRNDAV